MVTSQAISVKLEATMYGDSLNIIKVFSCYYGDKTINITSVKFKFI